MYCKNCGNKLDPNSEYCSKCGAKSGNSPQNIQQNQMPQQQYQQQYQNQPPRNNGGEKGWQIAAIVLAVVVVISGLGAGVYLVMGSAGNKGADTTVSDRNSDVSKNDFSAGSEKPLEKENSELEEKIEKTTQSAEEQALLDENARLQARLDILTSNIEAQNSSSGRQSGGTYFGNSYYISWSDLNGLSKDDIDLLRNEIYARNGYIFKDQAYRNYFSSMSWYYPNSGFHEGMFNSVEKANVDLIVEYEHQMGWR